MTGFSSEVRETVRQRSQGSCEVMACCQGRAAPVWAAIHHRRPRGMGSSKRPETNTAANALAVCVDCHTFIESQRGLAFRNGWLVRQHRNPVDVPILRRGRWVLLNNIGGVIPASVPCICGLYESEHLSANCPCTTYEPDAEAA